MTIITRLSNERIEELTELRLEKGLENIVTLLEVNELEMYMVNIDEAIERTHKHMMKYKEGGTSYNCYKEMNEELKELKKELEVKIKEVSKSKEEKKNTKLPKLTSTQKKFIEDLENATYSYRETLLGKTVDSFTFYSNGELVKYNQCEGYITPKTEATLIGENLFTMQGNTATIKALIKKGYIEASYIGGNSFDKISLVNPIEHKEPLKELEKITLSYTYYCDYVGKELTSKNVLYCGLGESEITIKSFLNKHKQISYDTKEVEVIAVDYWKGF